MMMQNKMIEKLCDYARFGGSLVEIQSLIDQGVDVSGRNSDGDTPLLLAAFESEQEIVYFLVRCGADLKCADRHKNTVLHYAVMNGWEDTVHLLIEYGVDIEIKDSGGKTPLMLAAIWEQQECVDLLISSGANLQCSCYDTQTVLHYAAKYGWDDTIRLLIEHKIDVNIKDLRGWTPLLLSARWGEKECVDLLIRSGADVHCSEGYELPSVLHFVVKNGWKDTTQLLLEQRLDVNAKDWCGDTPLHYALQKEERDMVEPLFKAGADWNMVNDKGESPFCLLVAKGYYDEIKQCIEMGAYVEPIRYEELLKVDSFKKGLLCDVKLCSQALINKFNLKYLPAVKEVARERLPPIDRMKIEKGSRMELEVEGAVSSEIQSKGHCDVLGTHIMVLSFLSAKSFIDYVDNVKMLKERNQSELNNLTRSSSGVEEENS